MAGISMLNPPMGSTYLHMMSTSQVSRQLSHYMDCNFMQNNNNWTIERDKETSLSKVPSVRRETLKPNSDKTYMLQPQGST